MDPFEFFKTFRNIFIPEIDGEMITDIEYDQSKAIAPKGQDPKIDNYNVDQIYPDIYDVKDYLVKRKANEEFVK